MENAVTACYFNSLVSPLFSFAALEELKDHLEHPNNLVEMKFLLLEQKYLEFLAQRNRIEALKVIITT